jgi:hypothetical protein
VGATRDQAGHVRNVGDEDRANLARDFGELSELDRPRDRRSPTEDELRPLPPRELADLIEIDAPGVTANRVLDRPETTCR